MDRCRYCKYLMSDKNGNKECTLYYPNATKEHKAKVENECEKSILRMMRHEKVICTKNERYNPCQD